MRLQNLVPLAGLGVQVDVTKAQIAHGLDLIVQLAQDSAGVRRVTRITEVRDLGADGDVELVDLFRFVPDRAGGGSFTSGPTAPRWLARLREVAPQLPATWFEPA